MSPLLIAAILQADPKITLDLPISPLSVIVKEVSDQAKTPLKVSGYDPHRRMFVQVKNMPGNGNGWKVDSDLPVMAASASFS